MEEIDMNNLFTEYRQYIADCIKTLEEGKDITMLTFSDWRVTIKKV
jgi:hypothetical protein